MDKQLRGGAERDSLASPSPDKLDGRSRRSGRGRPREFDEDELQEAIMRLFWRYGYDGVSFAQIEEAAGVCKTSLYASFGNKERLFRDALERYRRTSPALRLSQLDGARSLEGAIQMLLQSAATAFSVAPIKSGCMILTGTIASHPDNGALVRTVTELRVDFQDGVAAKLEKWLMTDVANSLARLIVMTMQGLALQVRDGASLAEASHIAFQMTDALHWQFRAGRG